MEMSDHLVADVRGWGHIQYLPNGAEVQDANGRLIAAAPELLELLALMFELYEYGPSCYEDPDDCSGYLGNAVRLDPDDFHRIADLLNRLDPRPADAKAA